MAAAPSGDGPHDSLSDGLSETEALAMDYALGAQDRSDRLAVAARLPGDPALAAAVARWQALLAPLDQDTPPVPPPPALWDVIAAETLALRPASRPIGLAAIAPAPSLWQRAGVWRGIAGGAMALAAALAALLLAPVPDAPLPAAGAPPLVAVLADAGGRPLAQAVVADGQLRLAPPAADAGRVLELWAIDGAGPPRSLGVADPATAAIRAAGLKPGIMLAISLEPRGGSPTGAPTGPIVATGRLGPA